MGCLYRRKTKRNGEITESKRWYVRYRDCAGQLRYKAAYTDKTASLQLLARLEREAARQLVGLADPYAESKKKLISDHVEAYETHLQSKGAGAKHVSDVVSRLTKLFAAISVAKIADLTADGAEAFLLSLVRDQGISKSTRNQYLTDLRAFVRWGVRTKRWQDNLVESLRPLRGDDDIRRRRRPLSEEELGRLLDAAERRPAAQYLKTHPAASPERIGQLKIAGRKRSLLYRVMAYTGLRVNEARTLTWGALDLDADPATLVVEARYAKNRRRDMIPLHPAIATELRRSRDEIRSNEGADPPADARVLQVGSHPERHIRRDLEFAGIAIRDETGAVVDLHSLRHTCATLLTRAGVAPRIAQALMRHSNLSTTMRVYTHVDLADQARAVSSLPIEDRD